MICPKCGNELPDNAKFCDICGANISTDAARTLSETPASGEDESKSAAQKKDELLTPDTEQEQPEQPAEKPKAASTKRNIIILVLVLVLVLVGAAVAVFAIGSQGSSEAEDILNTAERYLNEKNYEQAIFEFDKVISIDPMNVSAYIGKANAYIAAGDIAKAIETLEEGYGKTGSDEIKAKLDELTAMPSVSDLTSSQHPVGMTYGDARCLKIEQMLLDYINSRGELDTSMLAEVTELVLYSDCYISVICGNKGGTDLSDTTCFTAQGSVGDIAFAKHLVNAVRISIEGSAVTDLSPLSGLTGLKKLSLFGSYTISDISPLSGLTGLTHLDLGMARITDITPLASLTNLVSLDLNGNSISDISAVAGLKQLQYLDLSGNELTDISAVSGLTKLQQLALSINRISDISALSGLSELTALYLWENDITQISALTGLTKLETLNIEHNLISDISALSALSELEWLYITGNTVSDSSISVLQQLLPHCRIM